MTCTRRSFLKAGGALAAGTFLSCGTLAGGAEGAGNPLAVRLTSYGKFQDAAWQHLPSIGVHYLFLPVPEPAQVEETMKRLKDNKLAALVMRGDAVLADDAAVDQLAAQLAICEEMGVKYMFLSPKHDKAPKEAVYGRLRKLGDVAKSHGVTVTLETHPDLGTNGDVHVETMKAVDHPNIRVNFDTGNVTYYNEGRNAVDELKKVVDYLGTVELKDHSAKLEDWQFPALGQGKVDFPGVFKALGECKFAGPITIEFEGTKGVELTEAETKKAIEDSVAYLRTLSSFA